MPLVMSTLRVGTAENAHDYRQRENSIRNLVTCSHPECRVGRALEVQPRILCFDCRNLRHGFEHTAAA